MKLREEILSKLGEFRLLSNINLHDTYGLLFIEKFSQEISSEFHERENNYDLLASAFEDIGDRLSRSSQKSFKSFTDALLYYQYSIQVRRKYLSKKFDTKIIESKILDLYINFKKFLGIDNTQVPKASSFLNEIAHKEKIISIREETKRKLSELESLNKKSKDYKSLYVAKSSEISEFISVQMKEYLADIISDGEKLCGRPPCKYSVLGLGSMSTKQITPYSDLEFAFIIERDDEEIQKYFEKLGHYINFAITSLGESVLPYSAFGISLDNLVPKAVNLDLGGKVSLGRPDKDYKLVCTIDEMLDNMNGHHNKKVLKTSPKRVDDKLPLILTTTTFVAGNKELVLEYQARTKEFLDRPSENPSITNGQKRGIEALSEGGILMKPNLEEFQFTPIQKASHQYDVKGEIYRIPDRMLYNLLLIYKIHQSEYGISLSESLDKLVMMGEITEENALDLKFASSYANILRIRLYDHYGEQKESLDIIPSPADEGKKKIFNLEESEILFGNKDLQDGNLISFYYSSLTLMAVLKYLCEHFKEKGNLPEHLFKKVSFQKVSSTIKADICLRLGKHSEIEKFEMEFIGELKVELSEGNANIVHNAMMRSKIADSYYRIGKAYAALGNFQKAIDSLKKSLAAEGKTIDNCSANDPVYKALAVCYEELGMHKKASEIYSKIPSNHLDKSILEGKLSAKDFEHEMLEHISPGADCYNLGMNLMNLGDYENAYINIEKSLKINEIFFGKNNIHTATPINAMGLLHLRLKKYDLALKYFIKALEISIPIIGLNHIDIASYYGNLAQLHLDMDSPQEALRYSLKGLFIKEKILTKNHSSLRLSYNLLGEIYDKMHAYDKALEFAQKSFEIKKISQPDNYTEIKFSYNRIAHYNFKLFRYEKAYKYKKLELELIKKYQGTESKSYKIAAEHANDMESNLGNQKLFIKALEDRKRKLQEGISAIEQNPHMREFIKITIFLKARHFLEGALILFKGDQNIQKVKETLKLLIKLYEAIGDKKLLEEANSEFKIIYRKELEEIISLRKLEESIKEEYLSDLKKKEETNIEAGMQELSREITNFQDIPEKDTKETRIISYNIAADFFDGKDGTPDQRHIWENRKVIIFKSLGIIAPDIMCLQELSPKQAFELYKHFEEIYQASFLSQAPSDIGAGKIAKNIDVQDWIAQRAGTPLIGTFVKKESIISDQGRFWLNKRPDEVPAAKDRGETDKGFGNMNTYRAILWIKITSDGKEIYVFNSHYPLSGDNLTREKCAILEREKISEIAGKSSWVSCGDRNIIPTKSDDKAHNPKSVYNALVKGAYDIRDHNPEEHFGISGSWLGFSYDYKEKVAPGNPANPLDIMVSNLIATRSFFHPLGYKPGEEIPIALSDYTPETIHILEENRTFASDHALIGADIEF